MSSQKLNQRQARQALYLSRFDFTLKHIPGSSMERANSLSRYLDWQVEIGGDNKDKVLVKKKQLEVRAMQVTEVVIEEIDLLEKIRKSETKDNKVIKAVEEIKQVGVKMFRDKEWQKENRLILKDEKVYVLRDEKLRTEVIWLYYDIPVGEYRKYCKITELVTRNFWQSGVTKEVKKYIEGCDVYQRNKNHTEAPTGKLIPNAVPEKPWSYIIADFITKLLLAQGYDSILVVCDRITKITHFMPTIKKTSVEKVARLFQNNIWKLHSLPKSIIMDREVQFAAGMIKELNSILEIDTKLLIAYHPQKDKQMEKINQELEQYLLMFIDYRQKQQPDWLVITEFAYNNKVQTSTKVLLFKANIGQDLYIGFKMRKKEKFKRAEEFVTKVKEVHKEIEVALRKSQKKIRKYIDRKRSEAKEY